MEIRVLNTIFHLLPLRFANSAAPPPPLKCACSDSGRPEMYAAVEISWESTCSYLIFRLSI
ncbi:hypothetical protein YC2023_036757 [Brassica napus]